MTKTFTKKSLFPGLLQPAVTIALRNVTASFPQGITALCGPSGSGKSTLSKIIAGQFGCDEGGIVSSIADQSTCCTVYLDPLFYLSYDASKIVASHLSNNDDDTALDYLRSVFAIPEDRTVNALLESQRRLFEVLLALTRGGYDSEKSALVILDEYLDKDMSSVRELFFNKLRELCTQSQQKVKFQVLIVTHSKAVASSCDHIVVLTKGVVYNQGEVGRVMKYLPSEYIVLP